MCCGGNGGFGSEALIQFIQKLTFDLNLIQLLGVYVLCLLICHKPN